MINKRRGAGRKRHPADRGVSYWLQIMLLESVVTALNYHKHPDMTRQRSRKQRSRDLYAARQLKWSTR